MSNFSIDLRAAKVAWKNKEGQGEEAGVAYLKLIASNVFTLVYLNYLTGIRQFHSEGNSRGRGGK